MKSLTIKMENCYGIKKLDKTLPLPEKTRAVAIYAPNGCMKTSFADSFRDLSKGAQPRDRYFTDRVSQISVEDENAAPLPRESIFVVQPYDQAYSPTEQVSTLLVNDALKKQYDQMMAGLARCKETFLKAMKKQSKCGTKRNLEEEISVAFTQSTGQFFLAIARAHADMENGDDDAPFADVAYEEIFDEKILDFLSKPSAQEAIQQYVEQYNNLLEQSVYFRKGFNHYNAWEIAKHLAKHGFFTAKHTVTLQGRTQKIITNKEELEAVVQEEIDAVMSDATLKARFSKLNDELNKRDDLRSFREYLADHVDLLPELTNIGKFRQSVWVSYFKANREAYEALLAEYKRVNKEKAAIEKQASEEVTDWHRAIDTFNNRFTVPFKLKLNNQVPVMVGSDKALKLEFIFRDDDDGVEVPVQRANLQEWLSQGEKKALYLLNIIFEVEQRRKSEQQTLFIVDDVADSFDYKNKYAIVHYLKEIAATPQFYQIILTHNFDFFRTVASRFVHPPNCYTATKTKTEVRIDGSGGMGNVFVKAWKPKFYKTPKITIASIPFIRNIIEYTKGEDDPHFLKLTSLLHYKPDSEGILLKDLAAIFKATFSVPGKFDDDSIPVLTMIFREADACLGVEECIGLEDKVVLSIAIRLKAEKYMLGMLTDVSFANELAQKKQQTARLFEEFKAKASPTLDEVQLMDRVMLMTPEIIHLNSFMYEPIVDMSDWHLRELYKEVTALKSR